MLPLENNFWYFKSALSSKFCDEVIQYALSKPEMMGKIGINSKENLSKKEIQQVKAKRNSDVVWLNEPWIIKEIQLLLILQILMRVGIFNGILVKHVSLLNIN